jgi:hypothetical protein
VEIFRRLSAETFGIAEQEVYGAGRSQTLQKLRFGAGESSLADTFKGKNAAWADRTFIFTSVAGESPADALRMPLGFKCERQQMHHRKCSY